MAEADSEKRRGLNVTSISRDMVKMRYALLAALWGGVAFGSGALLAAATYPVSAPVVLMLAALGYGVAGISFAALVAMFKRNRA